MTPDSLLRAVLAADPRPTLILDGGGAILAANPAAQDGLADDWAGIAASGAWPALRGRAAPGVQDLPLGDRTRPAELVALDLPGDALFLLRLTFAADERAQLLTIVSHEMRTPIQSLAAAGEMILEATPDPDDPRRALAETVLATARIALDHANNILSLARMEHRGDRAEPAADFAPARTLRRIVDSLAPLAARQGNRMEAALPPDDIYVHGPEHHLTAIAQNLIGNAIKFTTGGSVRIRLEIAPGGADRALLLEVADTGRGIAPGDRARILLPFETGTPERVSIPEGAGIGMMVVTRAVERLKGATEIDSAPGMGATIRVRLTLPAADGPPPDPAAGPMADGAADDARLDGLRILIAEDNPTSRALLARALAAAGADVEEAADGPGALARLERGGLDLALLDLSMPGMNGLEVARRLRAGSGGPPLVGLTGHTDAGLEETCRAAGMDAVLRKPVGPAALRAALRALHDGRAAPVPPPDDRSGDLTGDLIDDLIDGALAAELLEEMGEAAGYGFMRRALDEAGAVLDDLARDGITPLTRKRAHSALGAAGLTGLAATERALRAIGATGADPASCAGALRRTLALTRREIDARHPPP